MGLVRGKNDKVDAQRIAEYIHLRRDKIKPYNLPSKNILQLKKVLNLRDKLVIQRSGYKADNKESKAMLKQDDYKLFFAIQSKMIHYLSKQILDLEKQITLIIKADPEINRIYELITSIKGVGMIVAINFIVLTNCFKDFSDSRKVCMLFRNCSF